MLSGVFPGQHYGTLNQVTNAVSQADGVVKLTCIVIGVFILNEALLVAWPSFAYPAIRTVVIPMLALVDIVASLSVLLGRKRSKGARIIAALGFGISSIIWAFQWLGSGALFGALMPPR
jgi:hypothetical protein